MVDLYLSQAETLTISLQLRPVSLINNEDNLFKPKRNFKITKKIDESNIHNHF